MANCSSPLHRVTDGAGWDAKDLFGRLCIVVHAAFLYAGLLPSRAPAATPCSLSRSYSVPQPPQQAARHHQGAAAGVDLRLSRPSGRHRRGYDHMLLRAYVTATDGGRCIERRRERLGCAALGTILSGGIDDTARALRAPGSAGARLWKLLTEGICRGLFLRACETNGVPVAPGFASLPGDVKMAILEKVEDGKDVAMAESASKELRGLVSRHGSELWKAKYEGIISSFPDLFGEHPVITDELGRPLARWKERYVMARRAKSGLLERQQREQYLSQFPWADGNMLLEIERLRESILIPMPIRSVRKVVQEAQEAPQSTAQRRAPVEEKSQQRRARRTMTTVPKRLYSREHHAGVVHSPSSQY